MKSDKTWMALGLILAIAALAFGENQRLYMAIGDSYSSGEGNKPFYDQACHRSHAAWPEAVAAKLQLRLVNAACSGATSSDLWDKFKSNESQFMELVRLKPRIITMTIGGNDIGFGKLLEDCWLPHNGRDCVPTLQAAEKQLEKKTQLTAGDVFAFNIARVIYELLSADPKGQLFVVGYPHLFPPASTITVNCGWLDKGEQTEANKLTDLVNHELEKAARESQEGRYPTVFVNTADAFKGHELCTSDSWVNPAGRLPLYNDGHPKPAGQAAIAQIVAEAIARS